MGEISRDPENIHGSDSSGGVYGRGARHRREGGEWCLRRRAAGGQVKSCGSSEKVGLGVLVDT